MSIMKIGTLVLLAVFIIGFVAEAKSSKKHKYKKKQVRGKCGSCMKATVDVMNKAKPTVDAISTGVNAIDAGYKIYKIGEDIVRRRREEEEKKKHTQRNPSESSEEEKSVASSNDINISLPDSPKSGSRFPKSNPSPHKKVEKDRRREQKKVAQKNQKNSASPKSKRSK
eukprot:TRINITY_DN5400_c0_g1_i8.p1 TRINITY_DN5400_c0_g1~~TRINITY_DN5400_c0_g1_i8.p1  ORF type:complete len:169 (-),score=18.36 TRINITY_DN5400_c0_g1_i8:155-661(-)